MTDTDEFLSHFGVKGMKWGRRNAESKDRATREGGTDDPTPSHARAVYNNAVKKAKTATKVGAGLALGATVALGLQFVSTHKEEIMGSLLSAASKAGSAKSGAAFAGRMLESSVKNIPYAKIAKGAYKVTSLK